jgi:spore maturation protein A
MLNKVWFWLLFIGIVYGFARASYESIQLAKGENQPAAEVASDNAEGKPAVASSAKDGAAPAGPEIGLLAMGKKLNTATLEAATLSVELCIGLIGIMAVWLGLMNVAKDAGLVDLIARMMQPLMRFVFPEIPNGHPAHAAVLLNLAANMLGLDNAATPMGLKAMQELQELNPVKDTATNSMAMFLAINTSSIVLVPFTIIGYRVLSGSQDPAKPVAGMLIATILSTIIAIIITRWMQSWPRFRVGAEDESSSGADPLANVDGGAST